MKAFASVCAALFMVMAIACGGAKGKKLPDVPQGKCIVKTNDGGDAPFAVSPEASKRLAQLANAHDDAGINQMVRQGLVFGVEVGTEVLIIDTQTTISEARIKAGQHKGKSGWAPHEFFKKAD